MKCFDWVKWLRFKRNTWLWKKWLPAQILQTKLVPSIVFQFSRVPDSSWNITKHIFQLSRAFLESLKWSSIMFRIQEATKKFIISHEIRHVGFLSLLFFPSFIPACPFSIFNSSFSSSLSSFLCYISSFLFSSSFFFFPFLPPAPLPPFLSLFSFQRRKPPLKLLSSVTHFFIFW